MSSSWCVHLVLALLVCGCVLVPSTCAQTEPTTVANITAICATSPDNVLQSSSSLDIADAMGAASCDDGGWTVTFPAGSYSGLSHCGVSWPSSTDLHFVADGIVEIDCEGAPAMWSFEYTGPLAHALEIGAEGNASGWQLTHAASFVLVLAVSPGVRIRIAQAAFTCTVAPGPAAVVVRTPNGLSHGSSLDIHNCSFTYTQAFAIAVMGSVNLSLSSSSFASFSRGSLFCVSDTPTHAHVELDAWPDTGPPLTTSVTCISCMLRVAGEARACSLPAATMPPLGSDFYDTCRVRPPPTSPPPRAPPPPPTPAPRQARLVVLALAASAIMATGLAALCLAAVCRARAATVPPTDTAVPPSDLVPLLHEDDYLDM